MTDHYYIHIPFCRQRCPYCKFALTPVFDEFKQRRYIEYLKREIKSSLRKELSEGNEDGGLVRENPVTPIPLSLRDIPLSQGGIQTIYFGGGTPSVLSHDEILEILECFGAPLQRSWHEVTEDFSHEQNLPFPSLQRGFPEITMEMNPEDITPEYIQGVLVLGINRISLGVQTLNEVSLKEIHRSDRNTIFGALESIDSILSSRRDPFQNHLGERDNPLLISKGERDSSVSLRNDKKYDISLNVDFILGLPFVKSGETLSGIRELHERFPYITHTSVYMLEDESYPKHWKSNSITEDDMQREFLDIMDYFESIGWHHYELSNFAKPGYESVHNQAYWDHSDTRGFGLSAASYENGMRWNNSSSFNGYYGGKRDNEEKLTPKDTEIEQMMFGLRRDGWNYDKRSKKLDTLIADGLIEIIENRIRPTKTGIFVIDHILSELI